MPMVDRVLYNRVSPHITGICSPDFNPTCITSRSVKDKDTDKVNKQTNEAKKSPKNKQTPHPQDHATSHLGAQTQATNVQDAERRSYLSLSL